MDLLVVRNASKLNDLLASRNVSADLIQKHLVIVTGNVKDVDSVTQTLFPRSSNSGVVDIIVSGIGGAPVFRAFPPGLTIDDPTVCQDATSTVLESLQAGLTADMKRPVFIVVSSTGISDHGRDIPIAMVPIYRLLLPVPHADKKKMETILLSEVQSSTPRIAGFVAVRPTMFTDGPLLAAEQIRSATESDGKVTKEAIGYTISRSSVGNWIYETLLVNFDKNKSVYLNQFVRITS